MSNLEKGQEEVYRLGGDEAISAANGLLNLHPELYEIVVGSVYGEWFSRTPLSVETRQTITVASLVGIGSMAQLTFHLKASLHSGMDKETLAHIILHCISYVGVPKVIDALRCLESIE